MKKFKFEPTPTTPFHFFASSVAQWRSGLDVSVLIADMKKDGLIFNLWYVPVANDAPYEINFYAPQVDGAIYLGYYTYEVK